MTSVARYSTLLFAKQCSPPLSPTRRICHRLLVGLRYNNPTGCHLNACRSLSLSLCSRASAAVPPSLPRILVEFGVLEWRARGRICPGRGFRQHRRQGCSEVRRNFRPFVCRLPSEEKGIWLALTPTAHFVCVPLDTRVLERGSRIRRSQLVEIFAQACMTLACDGVPELSSD